MINDIIVILSLSPFFFQICINFHNDIFWIFIVAHVGYGGIGPNDFFIIEVQILSFNNLPQIPTFYNDSLQEQAIGTRIVLNKYLRGNILN